MRKIMALTAGILALLSGSAMAIPSLQLDISGGTYDLTTETIIAPSGDFTLYAYLLPGNSNTLADTYYISAAVVPITTDAADLGSISFNAQTIAVTADMYFGAPPLEAFLAFDSGDLSQHGIYETYYREFAFTFGTDQIDAYNTQDRALAGDPIPTSGSGMYLVAFTVNTDGLDPAYQIHFDLYNSEIVAGRRLGVVDIDIDVDQFAPFSHDAGSKRVPEPATFLLLGIGIIGLGLFVRRAKKRHN